MNDYAYAVAFAAAALAGLAVTERGVGPTSLHRRLYIFGILTGSLGARLLYSAQYGWASAGMSFWGFCIGACAPFLLHQAWRIRLAGRLRWPDSDFPDAVAPALALGLGLQRLGCFLRGCCFGDLCELPWSVTYPAASPAWRNHLDRSLIAADAPSSLPVHPTQLYEAGAGFLVFLLLLRLRQRPPEFLLRYELLLGAAACYASLRFGIEFLRGDAGGLRFGPLTFSQGVSLLMLLLATVPFFYRRRRRSGGKTMP